MPSDKHNYYTRNVSPCHSRHTFITPVSHQTNMLSHSKRKHWGEIVLHRKMHPTKRYNQPLCVSARHYRVPERRCVCVCVGGGGGGQQQQHTHHDHHHDHHHPKIKKQQPGPPQNNNNKTNNTTTTTYTQSSPPPQQQQQQQKCT